VRDGDALVDVRLKQRYLPDAGQTELVRGYFGDVVQSVYIGCGERLRTERVAEDGSWDAATLLFEMADGRFVLLTNSEWASFSRVLVS
jgi:hypothetical protein